MSYATTIGIALAELWTGAATLWHEDGSGLRGCKRWHIHAAKLKPSLPFVFAPDDRSKAGVEPSRKPLQSCWQKKAAKLDVDVAFFLLQALSDLIVQSPMNKM